MPQTGSVCICPPSPGRRTGASGITGITFRRRSAMRDYTFYRSHMVMSPRLRRAALFAHITLSIGWMGAAVVFLALAAIGLSSENEQTARAAYLVMEPAARLALMPLAIGSLLS